MLRRTFSTFIITIIVMGTWVSGQGLLERLARPQDFISKRVSSFDRTGGNNDRFSIAPGETAVLAEIPGPAAIHHIWVTIAAEPFYGRKIVLRMYWDNEQAPSVEVPIGDFFGVGHGLNRNLSSLAIACSSQGRARNCYWLMPFRRSARITATNEGRQSVGAFYYYIDYRELSDLPENTPTFHAQYRQQTPCVPGRNYVLLEAQGRGHYVGCNLSILQRAMGWWGEGDDMIYVDGEKIPSLYGTGSEDYFSDAWGMREDENLFYGCPLQEPDFRTGAKATVFRHHIPDPIPFKEFISVTIEHGHANDRADYFSSTAYWYQREPHATFPPLPGVSERLPFALESLGMELPTWTEISVEKGKKFTDSSTGQSILGPRLSTSLTSFYNPQGTRYPVVMTDGSRSKDEVELTVPAPFGEFYNLDLFYLTGPAMGDWRVEIQGEEPALPVEISRISGQAPESRIQNLTLEDVRLYSGENRFVFTAEDTSPETRSRELGFIGLKITPSRRRFITEWQLIGPFDAPDMTFLQTAYPPESEILTERTYPGKADRMVGWTRIQTGQEGFVPLQNLFQPNEKAIVYGLVYVHSPDDRIIPMLIGSDDGVRVWLNGILIHSHPAYRGAYPDQDSVSATLRKGWNTVLIKVLQGAGGWGYYVRFVDPEGDLVYAAEKKMRGRRPHIPRQTLTKKRMPSSAPF